MTTKPPNPRPRSADKLVAKFERLIRDGKLPEGAALPPEREIVQEFGVSRTVAREAVLSLSSKGLVEARPGFRPIVRKPGYETAISVLGSLVPQLLNQPGGVRNLFDVRILTEASLVRTAAMEATRDQIRDLKDALERNGAAIEDSTQFYATDVEFHGVLYGIPDNPLLPALHRAYTEWLAPHWKNMPRLTTRNRDNFDAHSRIFD
ncbi:MAG: GntR family transcriptional regulator, partial [Pseudomonadota bacterium]